MLKGGLNLRTNSGNPLIQRVLSMPCLLKEGRDSDANDVAMRLNRWVDPRVAISGQSHSL